MKRKGCRRRDVLERRKKTDQIREMEYEAEKIPMSRQGRDMGSRERIRDKESIREETDREKNEERQKTDFVSTRPLMAQRVR